MSPSLWQCPSWIGCFLERDLNTGHPSLGRGPETGAIPAASGKASAEPTVSAGSACLPQERREPTCREEAFGR